MALLQIAEPGESTAPHQHRLAAGIDLGTTNSLVASVRSGVAETLPDSDGQHLLPSVVHYAADGPPVVGQPALSFAETDPLNTVASVKRLMGRGVEDLKQAGGYLPYEFVAGNSAMPLLHTGEGMSVRSRCRPRFCASCAVVPSNPSGVSCREWS